METTRNLEQLLIDRNGALTAALVRIRALAAERRTDRDMAFLFQTAENAIAGAGAPIGPPTTIGADFWRWQEIWTGKYTTEAASAAAAKDRRVLEARIVESRACCLPDVLAKVRLLREQEKGGSWINEDDMLASIAADLEHLATGGQA